MDFDIANLGIIKYDTLFATLGDNIEHINIKYNGKVYTEKDLEILEILKKIVFIKDYYPVEEPPFIVLCGGVVRNIDEARKIKEWLENDRK